MPDEPAATLQRQRDRPDEPSRSEFDLEEAVAPSEARIRFAENARSALLTGIFLLLVFYTLYFAREIVMPIVFAFLISVQLQPAMRGFEKLRLPSFVGAALLVLLLVVLLVGITSSIAGPAAGWFGKLPQSLPRLEEKLYFLKLPLNRAQEAIGELARLATPGNSGAMHVVVEESQLGGLLFSSTRNLLSGLIEMFVVLFFLLMSGDLFLRKLVEVLPRFRDKKRAVEISQELERHIAAFLATITMMNLAVGVAVGLCAWLAGLSDPVLWGALAFLLNYIPMLGPLAGIFILFVAALVSFPSLWTALLLAGAYLVIHILEGEVVTPMLLARRFTLNPVLVIISLIFWFWLWGVPGAVIAVPLLATAKIICDHIEPLMAVGHFIGA